MQPPVAGLPRILAIAREAKTRETASPSVSCTKHLSPPSSNSGNNISYIAVCHGAEIAIAKAKQTRIAAVGVHNSYFSGRNAYYVERIVNAGLVGLHNRPRRAAHRVARRNPPRLSAPTR